MQRTQSSQTFRPAAFRPDLRTHRALSAAKAAWWSAQYAAGRAISPEPTAADHAEPIEAPPPPSGRLRRAWREAFEKDAADVAAGLYPVTEAPPRDLVEPVRRAVDLLGDARAVAARRERGGGVEARSEPGADAYPAYYRQNFHFQSGGWFTEESARRYEAQVELLFSGAAGAMRRRALSLLARAWRTHDQRSLRMADVACGSGSFLKDLRATFPRASVTGVDLSAAYVGEARAVAQVPGVQANAERLPFANASLDGLSCIYLFHELPPAVRRKVVAEFARVLKPGGVLAFADSVQTQDAPDLTRLLQAFPAFFHEPFYASYQKTDLKALFAESGLVLEGSDQAFLTKALLLRKSIS
jgi:ubiquinone/menaquinone biosynthesis C-methylase UbiE